MEDEIISATGASEWLVRFESPGRVEHGYLIEVETLAGSYDLSIVFDAFGEDLADRPQIELVRAVVATLYGEKEPVKLSAEIARLHFADGSERWLFVPIAVGEDTASLADQALKLRSAISSRVTEIADATREKSLALPHKHEPGCPDPNCTARCQQQERDDTRTCILIMSACILGAIGVLVTCDAICGYTGPGVGACWSGCVATYVAASSACVLNFDQCLAESLRDYDTCRRLCNLPGGGYLTEG